MRHDLRLSRISFVLATGKLALLLVLPVVRVGIGRKNKRNRAPFRSLIRFLANNMFQ